MISSFSLFENESRIYAKLTFLNSEDNNRYNFCDIFHRIIYRFRDNDKINNEDYIMLPINNKMLSVISVSCLLTGIISTTNVSAKESADYSSLFTEEKTACLSLKEMAKATDLPPASVSKGKSYSSKICVYKMKLPNKEAMRYSYGPMTTSIESVKKEIRAYQKSKKRNEVMYGMEIELTDTGDSYLLHQPMHGRLLLQNADYGTIILTNYAKTGFKLKEKKVKQSYAVKIANYLLEKHKK